MSVLTETPTKPCKMGGFEYLFTCFPNSLKISCGDGSIDVKSEIIEPKEKPYLLGFSSYTRYNENN